jgi:hypothetical protein
MIVFDCEANGLHPDKFWCMSKMEDGKLSSTTKYAQMRSMLTKADVLIGHNITRWDIPNLERVLNIEVNAKLVDTLALSWYLEPKRVIHGLDSYGADAGIPKPKISNWDDLTVEEYVHRCEEDVKINTWLWKKQWSHLLALYGSEEEAWRLIDYLSFKMDCAREQERVKWKLDVGRCERVLEKLSKDKEEKTEGLVPAMPKVPVWASKKPVTTKLYKKNGELSVNGMQWQQLLQENNLPLSHNEDVKYIKDHKDPNPNSYTQLKAWLYDLGWVPETFKYDRNKETGDVRKIEQINMPFGAGICPSIKRLYGKEPSLELLDGLSVISHRISILKGFLSAVDDDGYVQAQVQGLTNTLRWKHKVCVNLPGIDKPYGEDIRGCLIAPEGYVLVGSDMSSLEDRTKQHYMWDFDPDYVKEMCTDDFDPHLDLCVAGGLLSVDAVAHHKSGSANHSKERKLGKAANYACVYGAGGATVARSAGISEREGVKLVEAYWKRNWSVEAIAADQITKTCRRQKWLYNPVSKLWYSLRAEKDRFSTLNQGTGVWCFDTWVKYIRQGGLPITANFHDEVVCCIQEKNEQRASTLLRKAITQTNEELQLNRGLDISIDFGGAYSEIH